MKKTFTAFSSVVFCLALIFSMTRCESEREREKEAEHAVKAPPRVAVLAGEKIIKLSKAEQEKAGIVTGLLNGASVQEKVKAYGSVLSMQDLLALQNRFITARAEKERAEAELKASRAEYKRLKGLRLDDNVSAKALESAQADFSADEAGAREAKKIMSVIESECRQQWGETVWNWLSNEEPALEHLLNGQDSLILVTVPVEVSVSSELGRALVQDVSGKLQEAALVSPSPRMDQRFQGKGYFYIVTGSQDLPPGANVTVFVQTGSFAPGFIVPVSAVLWWEGTAWIYVEKEPGAFGRKVIPTDNPVLEGWFVSKGFDENQPVVIKGGEQLLSEEFRSRIQAGEDEE